MNKKDLLMKNLGLKYINEFIGLQDPKSIREQPELTFITAIGAYDFTSDEDVLLLTGLSKRAYRKIFGKRPGKNYRYIKTDYFAITTLERHLDIKGLTPGQRAMSMLLWKCLQHQTIGEIALKFHLVTDDKLEDVCPQYFEDGLYGITPEELNDAVILSMDTLHEIYARRTGQAE
jgi:hypothetical protein